MGKTPCMICGHWLKNSPYVEIMIGKVCLAKSSISMGENNEILNIVYGLKCGDLIKKEVSEFIDAYSNEDLIEGFKKDYEKDIKTLMQNKKEIISILKFQKEIEGNQERLNIVYKMKGESIIIEKLNNRINGLRLSMGASLKESNWVNTVFKIYKD